MRRPTRGCCCCRATHRCEIARARSYAPNATLHVTVALGRAVCMVPVQREETMNIRLPHEALADVVAPTLAAPQHELSISQDYASQCSAAPGGLLRLPRCQMAIMPAVPAPVSYTHLTLPTILRV